MDAQDAKARELAKRAGQAPAANGRDAEQKHVKDKKDNAKDKKDKEIARLQSELAALRSSQPTKADGAAAAAPAAAAEAAAPADAQDQEYQRQLDDLERQLAGLRRLAKEVDDATAIEATAAGIEQRAAQLREARRACWSVPRLLDRHRSRVAEREQRVAKASERMDELQAAKAELDKELAEAAAHLAAKREDLEAERVEVAKLESQMPQVGRASATAAAAPVPPATFVDLDQPDAEQKLRASLQAFAARMGGAWSQALAALPAVVPIELDPSQDVGMGTGTPNQNAVVQRPPAVTASSQPGAALSMVPSLAPVGRKLPEATGDDAQASKIQKRG